MKNPLSLLELLAFSFGWYSLCHCCVTVLTSGLVQCILKTDYYCCDNCPMLRHWNGLRIASLKWALGLDYNTLQHRVDLGIDRITAKWTLCVDQVTILRQNGCLVLIVLHCCIKEYPLFWSRYIKMDAWFLHCCIKTDSLFWSRYIKMHAFLWLFYITGPK